MRRAFLMVACAAALVSLTATACGPGKPALTPAQSDTLKAHMAVARLKTLTPLQTAASFCMHGIFGAAKDQAVNRALDDLFAQETGKAVTDAVFTAVAIHGDEVSAEAELKSGQVLSGTFDIGRVIYAIVGVIPGFKLFGLIGDPAIDCTEAAFWLDGTLGGQLGSLLAAKFNPPPVSAAVLASRPSAIAGSYTLRRRLESCGYRTQCYLNPMKVKITCTGVSCTVTRTNKGGNGQPPWDHALSLVFGNGEWRAAGTEKNAYDCHSSPVPGTGVKLALKVASGAAASGVWQAQQLTGTYTIMNAASSCGSPSTSVEHVFT